MYNVKDFGATGVASVKKTLTLKPTDYKWVTYQPGVTAVIRHPLPDAPLDSVGIQRALDAAHAAGGGTVFVPAGDYAIGPLRLRSHVELRLGPGARLWASTRLEDFQAQPNLLLAENAENVSLTGPGEIHGQSPHWLFPWLNEGPPEGQSLNDRRPGRLLLFQDCQHVAVRGVRIFDSPLWTLVFLRCRHVAVRGVFMRHFDIINADGIDLVDSQDVTISDCDLYVSDDAICMKSAVDSPCAGVVRNVAVTNCVIRTMCNAIKLGTESRGLFENITVSNIVVYNPDDNVRIAEGGINIALCDGGMVRNVSFSNFVMRNVECPFYLVVTRRSRFRPEEPDPSPGTMERVTLTNIRTDGFLFAPFVVGCPGSPVRDVVLSGIHLRKTGEFRSAPFPVPVPECGEQYPMPFMFGSPNGGRRGCGDGLPAHGLYLRDVHGLRARDFKVDCAGADARPCHVRERCRDIELDDFLLPHAGTLPGRWPGATHTRKQEHT